MKDTHVNTKAKVENDGGQRMPHERDEAPDAQGAKPRKVMQQAASDIARGLVDTDRHNQPGVEATRAPGPSPGTAQPQAGTKRD